MKILSLLALMLVSSFVSALPVTHVFSGLVTFTGDEGISDAFPGGDRSAYDWWPEVGDRYHGVVTYDTDQIITSMPGDECALGPRCGGVVLFEIALGERLITYDVASATADAQRAISWESEEGSAFTAFLQVIRNFDTFAFDRGSFDAVEATFFDGIRGEGDVWVQVAAPVPETAPFLLLAMPLLGMMLKRLQRRRQCRN